MLQFRNDYSEGAHPKVLDALLSTNLQKTPRLRHRSLLRRRSQHDPLPVRRPRRPGPLPGGGHPGQ